MNDALNLILASQSPRRAQLLAEAGLDFEQRSPPFADPDQPPRHLKGHEAEAYATLLAVQKANSLAEVLQEVAQLPGVILAADTICVDDAGELVGKPRDLEHAREMIGSFIESEHRVLTGVALLRVDGRGRELQSFADTAVVRFGAIRAQELETYLATNDWQGKAGGYNLFDRQAAGWPIEVDGDPATVVGLPMKRLIPMIQAAV